MNKRIIPSLLLKDEGLVKGVKYKDFKYLGDPVNTIKIFNDKEVDELFFFDIDASKENRCISFDLVRTLSEECFMPFGVGGGITDVDQVRQLLRFGAEKVCINTSSILDKNIIKKISQEFGSQSLVVSIDIGKNFFGKRKISTHNGSKFHKIGIYDWAKEIEKLGAGEILVNCIYNDGKMKGYDLNVISRISDIVKIPVISLRRNFNS